MQEERNEKYCFNIIRMIYNPDFYVLLRIKSILIIMLIVSSSLNLYSQNIAVKTNLLYDLTTSLNVGGEIRCNDTYSISTTISYNPWTFADNRKMKHFLIQPELRRWFDDVFVGNFIGIQTHYAQFNFGGMLPWGFGNGKMFGLENPTILNNRFQGNLIGLGLSYGYQWMISPLWNLEASIALGYAYLNYDRYGQAKGAPRIEKSHANYVGPTQIGISLIYFIQ